jgi:5-carboxymethyl-2-hydroxymuconate isomerase
MPHLIIEYSKNLRDTLGPDAFLEALHETAIATGEFPPMSLRSRAVEVEHYRVGDGHPENGFVHVVLRIRPGRERERKLEIGEAIFGTATTFLAEAFDTRPLGLTFEIHEIDVAFRFLKNSMSEYWAKRSPESSPTAP